MNVYPTLGELYLNRVTQESALKEIAKNYQEKNFVVLPNFVDPVIFKMIEEAVESSEIEIPASWKWLSDRYNMQMNKPKLAQTLISIFNEKNVVKFFKDATGIQDIKFITAFLYSVDTNISARTFDWHDDLSLSRVFGMSIQAGQKDFKGGDLCLRKKSEPDSSLRISLKDRGDAVLFKVGADFEHAVAPVEGPGVRRNIVVFGHTIEPEGISFVP